MNMHRPVLSIAFMLALAVSHAYAKQDAPKEQKSEQQVKKVSSPSPETSPVKNLLATASPPAEPEVSVNQKDLNRVVAITEELRTQLNQGANSPGWLARLDASLDTSLAATLAGLAIAAATFLISFTAPLAEKLRRIRDMNGNPSQADTNQLEKMKTAVSQLMFAFYVFVGFLVESLTLDQWEEPGAWMNQYASLLQIAAPADTIIAGGCLVLGMFLLGKGAQTIKSIVTG